MHAYSWDNWMLTACAVAEGQRAICTLIIEYRNFFVLHNMSVLGLHFRSIASILYFRSIILCITTS